MSDSSIITVKTERDSGWTHLNLQVVENSNLSIQARFLHTILISRPPGWEARRQWLIEIMGSRYAFDKGAQELEEAGYLRRQQQRNNGVLTHSQYTVGDRILDHRVQESNTREDHRVQESRILSSDPLNNNQLNNNHLGKAGTNVPVRSDDRADLDPHSPHIHKLAAKKQTTLEEDSKMPDAYLPIVDAWGKVATAHAPVTKTMARAKVNIRKARTGTLFKGKTEFIRECRKYSVTQIVHAIERFGKMRNDPDYLPKHKKWLKEIRLDEFFWNQFSNGKKSMFATCIKNGLMLASDAQPEITEFVAEQYNIAKGGKIAPETATRIAAKLHRYWVENERHLKHIGLRNEKTMVMKWLSFLGVEIPDWGPQHFLAPDIHVRFEKYVQQ